MIPNTFNEKAALGKRIQEVVQAQREGREIPPPEAKPSTPTAPRCETVRETGERVQAAIAQKYPAWNKLKLTGRAGKITGKASRKVEA